MIIEGTSGGTLNRNTGKKSGIALPRRKFNEYLTEAAKLPKHRMKNTTIPKIIICDGTYIEVLGLSKAGHDWTRSLE